MLNKFFKAMFQSYGYEVRRINKKHKPLPVEFTQEEIELIDYIKSFKLSMSSDERLWATLMTCKYVIDRDIQGDFVECGAWRGGNSILAAQMFKLYGVEKKVWVFDTFKGMTAPTEFDIRTADGKAADSKFLENQRESHNDWCFASLEDVKNNFSKKGLLSENVIFVEGDVCQTLENNSMLPKGICVLRLDTDWYESTKKELEVLYPKLTENGCLIIDDYGHWSGSKKATDEYFKKYNNRPFFSYIDRTGRVGVKVAS